MKPMGRLSASALCSLGVLAAAALDAATGSRLLMAPLYAVPVGFGAWALGRGAGFALAALSTAAARVVAAASGPAPAGAAEIAWNTAAQMALFLAVALLTAGLRERARGARALERKDPLTGLANLEAFRERAALEIERSRRWQRPLTLASVELDHLVALSAEFGRKAGDEALRTVAASFRSAFRSTDLPARVGPARLVLLLPETDRRGARVVLEKAVDLVRRDLDRGGWPVAAIACSVTSWGLVEVDELLRRAEELLKEVRADTHRTVRSVELGSAPS